MPKPKDSAWKILREFAESFKHIKMLPQPITLKMTCVYCGCIEDAGGALQHSETCLWYRAFELVRSKKNGN